MSNKTNTANTLQYKGVSCRYKPHETDVLENISTEIPSAQITGIIGPNGAGKSTLIKATLDLIPYQGKITKPDNIAYIPQRKDIDWDFPISALDVCLMGLYPQIGWLKRIKKEHKAKALEMLEHVKLADKAHSPIGTLSGGQQQRVFMARALIQDADLFLLDEPMVGIDAKTQELLFEIFQQLKKQNKTIVIVHHNLITAQNHFDHVILLNKSIIATGPPEQALMSENLNQAYQ